MNANGTSPTQFVSGALSSSVLNVVGTSPTAFIAAGTITAAEAHMAGSADVVEFVGSRKRVARCLNAFTYTPPPVPAWVGTLRRQPMISVRDMLDDAPNTSSFTDTQEVQLGADVQMDVGTGRLMAGTIQSYDLHSDSDQKNSWVWDARIIDYTWLLNGRRPFGCWIGVSATTIILEMMTRFGPIGYTTNNVVAGLPAVTVTFDGSLLFTECLQTIATQLGGAHFKVDDDRDLHFFFEEVTDNPAVIDDSNPDLTWDSPITMTKDTSQLRNRVFVVGANARLLVDTLRGSTVLEVDGIDIFNVNGGTAIIGCNRITYQGVLKTFIYPTPDASQQDGPPITSDWLISPGNIIEEGPIRTTVRYSSALVFNGKEGPRSAPTGENVSRFNPGFGIGGTFHPFAGFLPPGNHLWVCAFRDSGGLLYDLNIGTTNGGGSDIGMMELNWNAGSGISNDFRPKEVVLFRKADILDGDPGPPGTQNGWFYEVASQPYIPGTTAYMFFDGKADESLGNSAPWDDGTYAFLRYDTIGSRINIHTLNPRNVAFAAGATQLKIYREEKFNGPFDNTWTEPVVCMTFDTTLDVAISDPISHEDLKSTTAHLYALGEAHNASTPIPPPIQPKIRLVLYGVSGLDEDVKEGDLVSIFVQRDDLTAQVAAAQREGGSGLHEMMIIDTSLTSESSLIIRGDAELTLYANPIVTVAYSTRDPKSRSGKTVVFNLTTPPIVATLKITEVTIDQIHEADNLIERYNVTASSVRFTLEDLLRRARLR